MSRFAPRQHDLFKPIQTEMFSSVPSEAAPGRPPLEELAELLDRLRQAECLPWPDAAATMAEERRALGLARLAGAEGQLLAAAILEETERLLHAAETAAA